MSKIRVYVCFETTVDHLTLVDAVSAVESATRYSNMSGPFTAAIVSARELPDPPTPPVVPHPEFYAND